MAVGDNFDTSTTGLTNRRTNRIAGSFESGLTKQENNYGHPCNIGCGCKKVCDGALGPCLLPPELTISIVNSPDGRTAVRKNHPSYKDGEIFHLVFNNGVWRGRKCCTEIFGEGSYSCDPCSVTTLPDGRKAEEECSYYGKEGTSRPNQKGNTTRPYPIKTPYTEFTQLPVHPDAQGNCRPDGEKAKVADDYCWDNIKFDYAVKDVIQCFTLDGKYELEPDLDYPDKERDCEAAGYKPVAATRRLNQKECLESARCFGLKKKYRALGLDKPGERSDAYEEVTHIDKWECMAGGQKNTDDQKNTDPYGLPPEDQDKDSDSDGMNFQNNLTWSLDWKPGHQVTIDRYDDATGYEGMGAGTYTVSLPDRYDMGNMQDPMKRTHEIMEWAFGAGYKVLAGGYDKTSCCGGHVIDELHSSHTPNMGAGMAGMKHSWQGTCVTPYQEVILKPGRPDNMTPGAAIFECATGTQNSYERFEFHDDLASSGFTLIIRDCNFYNDWVVPGLRNQRWASPHYGKEGRAIAKYDAPVAYDEEIGDKDEQPFNAGVSGGEETILFIPMDQIMNCSNFALTEIGQTINSKRQGWQEEYGDLAGNPVGDIYPGEYGSARGKDYCMDPSAFSGSGPNHHTQDDDWAHSGQMTGQGSGGSRGFKRSGVLLNGEIVESKHGNCSRAWYQENTLGLSPHNGRSYHAPGDFALRKLNLQPQPFKATEWKQNKKKTLKQAQADQKIFSECMGINYPMYCNFMGLPFWFDHDFNWETHSFVGDKYGGRYANPDTCGSIGDELASMLKMQFHPCEDIYGYREWNADEEGFDDVSVPECAGSKCVFDVVRLDNEFDQEENPCICTHLDDKGATTVQGALHMGGDSSGCSHGSWKDHSASEVAADCTPLKSITNEEECMAESVDYCTDGNYISIEGCLNGGGDWQTTTGSWMPTPIPPSLGIRPECWSCGHGYGVGGGVATWIKNIDPALPEVAVGDYEGQTVNEFNMDNEDGSTTIPGEVKTVLEKAYTPRKEKMGERWGGYAVGSAKIMGEESLNSLDYWGQTGLWPEGQPDGAGTGAASYVAHTLLALNTTRAIQYASNTTPVIIQSINHGLYDGDHITTFDILGNFKANALTNGEWGAIQWEGKRGFPCEGDCEEPIWPNVVCPCNDGKCSHSKGADSPADCEKIRNEWADTCKVNGVDISDDVFGDQREDDDWSTERAAAACWGSGECWQTNLGGEKIKNLSGAVVEAWGSLNLGHCNKYRYTQLDLAASEFTWVSHNGVGTYFPGNQSDDPVSSPCIKDGKWQRVPDNQKECEAEGGTWRDALHKAKHSNECTDTNHKNKEDCLNARPSWTWNEGGNYGEDNQHCMGMRIKGKNPPPASFFVVKPMNDDEFALYTCDGKPLDGSITEGSCEGQISEKACTSQIPNIGVISKAIYSVNDNNKLIKEEVTLDEAQACLEYGGCSILDEMAPELVMTKADCTTLAENYSDVSINKDGVFSYVTLSASLTTDPHDKHACVVTGADGAFDVSECWLQLEWRRKKDIIAEEKGETLNDVDSWATCPFTGSWSLWDMSAGIMPSVHTDISARRSVMKYDDKQANVLGLNHIPFVDDLAWRPWWTESYYKGTDVGVMYAPSERDDDTGETSYGEGPAGDNYVYIHQEETCPVCCDHFMPETIYAAVDGLPESRGGTNYFNALKSGHSHTVRIPVTEKGYCTAEQADGTYKRDDGRDQENCYMKESDDLPYAWFTPTEYKKVHCGINSCTGKWHEHHQTAPIVIDPRTNQPGKVGGEYCCDCDYGIFEGQYYSTSCMKCSDAIRFNDPVVKHVDGDGDLGIPKDPCCACDCNPGDANLLNVDPSTKQYPTVQEVCDRVPEDGKKSLKIGKLTCKTVKIEKTCESKYKNCLSLNIGSKEDSEGFCALAEGCSWEPQEIPDPDGGDPTIEYFCADADSDTEYDHDATCGNKEESACDNHDLCSWNDSSTACACGTEGDGRIGCAGFPNLRSLSCEPSLIGVPLGACQYDFNGARIKAGGDTITSNGFYINKAGGKKGVEGKLSGSDGCDEPNNKAMPTAECYTNKYKTGDGCSGMGLRNVQMDYNGSNWVSSWFPMMGDSPGGTSVGSPEFVGGMNCKHFSIAGHCQDQYGNEKTKAAGLAFSTLITYQGVGTPFGFGPNDALCGECAENSWMGAGKPPVPSPEYDAYLMRLRLGCGGMHQMYQGADTLKSYDSYQIQNLSLWAEIAKCQYHGCNSNSVMDHYRPPCPPAGKNCVSTHKGRRREDGEGFCMFQDDQADGYCTCPVEDKSASPDFIDDLTVKHHKECFEKTHKLAHRWWDDDVCGVNGKPALDDDGEEITDPYDCEEVDGQCANEEGEATNYVCMRNGVPKFGAGFDNEDDCTVNNGTWTLMDDKTTCEAGGATWHTPQMGVWRYEGTHCGGIHEPKCKCMWSHAGGEVDCLAKGGKWYEVDEVMPHSECVSSDFWGTVPGLACDAQLPCTECCTYTPFKGGVSTTGSTTAINDKRKYTSCASSTMISNYDSNSTPYGLEGRFIPKWKKGKEANMDRATSSKQGGKSWTGYAPKTQEVFTVYYAESVGSSYDKLVVSKGSKQACQWFNGDPVSIGQADRTEAELGQGGPATRDRLSTQADWPNHPTSVKGGIKSGKYRWKINKQGAPDDPLPYMEISVDNASHLISRAHMHQEKYWRAAERYLQGEPWPYGDKPWPVGHQANSSPTSHTVNVAELESVGGGGYTVANAARGGRIGHLPTLTNIKDPKKAVFISEWPKMEMTDDTENPQPINSNDFNLSVSIAEIENNYDWDIAYCTNPVAKDEETCKAIGHCLGPVPTKDGPESSRPTLDKYTTKDTCEVSNSDPFNVQIKTKEERKWVQTAWWMPIFKYTEFTMGAREATQIAYEPGKIIPSTHDLKAGEKIIINGSQCFKATCSAPGKCEDANIKTQSKCIAHGKKWTVNQTWELPAGITNEELDKTLCETVYGGAWDAIKKPENLQIGCPPLCRLDKWFQQRACDGDWCVDCTRVEPECTFKENGDKVGFVANKDLSYCKINGKVNDKIKDKQACLDLKESECLYTSGAFRGEKIETYTEGPGGRESLCADPFGSNSSGDNCPCCPDPTAYNGTMRTYPNCSHKWTVHRGEWIEKTVQDPNFLYEPDCKNSEKCYCGADGDGDLPYGSPIDPKDMGQVSEEECDNKKNAKWLCGKTHMEWKGEETYCPECAIDGAHVVGLISGDSEVVNVDPKKGGKDDRFTIVHEQVIMPERRDSYYNSELREVLETKRPPHGSINPPDWDQVLNEHAVVELGHEVRGGTPKNLYKGVIYAAGEVNDEGAASEYAGGMWSRHGGTFNIVVGAKPHLDDCAQGNSNSPVNLTYFFDMDNSMCNHYMPVIDDDCAKECQRGYGPYTEPNMSFDERGRALIRVDIYE